MTTLQIDYPGGRNRTRKFPDYGHDPQADPERLVWYFKTSADAAAVSAQVAGSRVTKWVRGYCIALAPTGHLLSIPVLLGRDGHPVYPAN